MVIEIMHLEALDPASAHSKPSKYMNGCIMIHIIIPLSYNPEV